MKSEILKVVHSRQKEQSICSRCHAGIEYGWNFCGDCGLLLKHERKNDLQLPRLDHSAKLYSQRIRPKLNVHAIVTPKINPSLDRAARQERVISILEATNIATTQKQRPSLNDPLRRPERLRPRDIDFGYDAPIFQPRSPFVAPAPISFTEWHLKTVYGIHFRNDNTLGLFDSSNEVTDGSSPLQTLGNGERQEEGPRRLHPARYSVSPIRVAPV